MAETGVTANAPDGMGVMATFGGFHWAAEAGTNLLHFWSELDGIDFEGGGRTDVHVIPIGPPGGQIVNLQPFNNQLWVFRPDGAWVVGEDHVAYHTLDYSSQEDPYNFRSVEVHQGFMYFTLQDKIYKYKSGLQDVTPPAYWQQAGDERYVQSSEFQGLHSVGKFLYCTAYNEDLTYIYFNQYFGQSVVLLAYDGVGWHQLYALALQLNSNAGAGQVNRTPESYEIVRHGCYSHPQGNRLYVYQGHYGNTAPSDPTYSTLELAVEAPQTAPFWADQAGDCYVFPLADNETTVPGFYHFWAYFTPSAGNQAIQPEGSLFTSWYDFGMTRIPKSWRSVTIEGEFPTHTVNDPGNATWHGSERTTYVTVWGRTDESSTLGFDLDLETAAGVGGQTGSFTANLQERFFPAGTESTKMQLMVFLRTEWPTITPVVRTIIIKAMMRPDVLYGISTDIIVSNDLSDHRRKMLGLTANEIRTRLKEARASVSPITFTDLHGDSTSAYLASLRFIVVEYEDESAIEEIARVTFVNV
jgi:hypothetical protein